jgi:hypothetical protein
MNEIKIRPSDLDQTAQELRETGKMPKLEDVLKAVAETRAKYADKIKTARHQNHPADSLGANNGR